MQPNYIQAVKVVTIEEDGCTRGVRSNVGVQELSCVTICVSSSNKKTNRTWQPVELLGGFLNTYFQTCVLTLPR